MTTKQTDPQYKLRLPPELKERIEKAALENKRSMNAEIVARLELTFEQFYEYNAVGMGAFATRLEAGVEAVQDIAHRLIYELRAAAGYMSEDDERIREAVQKYADAHGRNLGTAVNAILKDWLTEHGYLGGHPQKSGGDAPN